MKINISKKQILQYILPITIITFLSFTIERNVKTEGGYEKLYGFPFSFISSNAGCTFCYQFYFIEFFFDLLIYLGFYIFIFTLIDKYIFHLKTNMYLIWLIYIVIFIYLFFVFYLAEYRFNWLNSDLYSIQNKSLHFGSYP